MPRRAKANPAQPSLMDVATKTAPCVPAIREAVAEWAASGYPGVTETTRTLLNYWFHTDHLLPGRRRFAYYPFQRDAVRTLVYLYEVAGLRRHKALLERYTDRTDLRLLQYDLFPRYCLKMATGSGKTKVIALVVAWQYLNAVVEQLPGYATTSLLIAPNIIVLERLRHDFDGGRIFRTDPIIPRSLDIYWEMECYMRGDNERAGSSGALYLTNVQQLYEREEAERDDEPGIMTQMLGRRPSPQLAPVEPFEVRLARRGGPLLVVNDEAHHTHDEESEWNQAIRRLHTQVSAAAPDQGVLQLDMSATPRYTKGSLFTWTVYDYPLKQAILDNVVKRPLKGVASGLQEVPSDIASRRYQAYLAAGVGRWREYRDALAPLQRKPVLFVMMNSTAEADDVAEHLRTKYPDEFAGDKLQVIHTDQKGEVSKRELETARRVSQQIDDPANPINAIVSVLMLREGWDVQSVTVVVGLRPYSSKANILPEQTIGRGLRLMFRGSISRDASYREQVDVIGNKAFLEFVEQLEKDEDLELETVDLDKQRVEIQTIFPDPTKQDKDIAIPVLSPLLTRKTTLAQEIAAIDVSRFRVPRLPKKENEAAAQRFKYEGFDLITLEKMVEREFTIPEAQTSQEVISYYARHIANAVKLPSQFAALVPKVREFLAHHAFGEMVDLDDPAMIRTISHKNILHVTLNAFVAVLREKVVEAKIPTLEHAGRPLSECEGFPWSRPTLEASKTVFNRVAAENQYEKAFAAFLEKAPDVLRFAKVPERFGFIIAYTDSAANLRYYEPDFVAVTSDGAHHLLETKGREDTDVRHKDRAAAIWCENATVLTGMLWSYQKILQTEFERLRPDDFSDLSALEPIQLL